MSGWQIFILILFILFLVGQLRVGADVRYGQDGAIVRVRIGAFKITLFPRQAAQKEKKPKRATKKAVKAAQGHDDAKEKKQGKKLTMDQILDLAQQFVPLLLEAASCFWSKMVMDILEISVTIGSRDPADAALLYGQANAALGCVWRPLNEAFHVKNGRGHVGIDFDSESIALYVHMALSLKIGQIFWLGVCFTGKAMGRFFQYKKVQKAKQQDRKAV